LKGRAVKSARIEAPPQRVYEILADYRRHHPRIIPREYFLSLVVEEGGVGAGTRMRIEMRVMGKRITAVHVVSEPEPGRVLVEGDVSGSTKTTFTVDPTDDKRGTHLTIATEFVTQREGMLGMIERAIGARVLRRIYRRELALIADYAPKVTSAAEAS
jgi:hypothetical protein